jgi:hypothetical protein
MESNVRLLQCNVIISHTLHYGSCQDAHTTVLGDLVGICGRLCLIKAVTMLLYGCESWALKQRHENVIRYSGHKNSYVGCGMNIM